MLDKQQITRNTIPGKQYVGKATPLFFPLPNTPLLDEVVMKNNLFIGKSHYQGTEKKSVPLYRSGKITAVPPIRFIPGIGYTVSHSAPTLPNQNLECFQARHSHRPNQPRAFTSDIIQALVTPVRSV